MVATRLSLQLIVRATKKYMMKIEESFDMKSKTKHVIHT